MGRKKKKQVKPWCWYCNREFDDEKILIQHQKSKHFKCTFCHKKLYTGPGLSIHSIQVHKEKIDKIPYALPHRCNVDLEIYGMEGIPDEDFKEHERNKSGKEDEIEEKRMKVEYTPVLSAFPMQSMTPSLPYIQSMSLPLMPPLQFGLAPSIFVNRPTFPGMLPPSFGRMPHMIAAQMPPPPPRQPSITYCSNDQLEISDSNNIPPPPPPPPPTISSMQSHISTRVTEPIIAIQSQTPTFPAYSNPKEHSKEIIKVTKPTSSTANVQVILVHPEDDIPLEQIRLRLLKYSSFLTKKAVSDDLSWTKSNQSSTVIPQGDCNSIPPPPPYGNSYVGTQLINSHFDRRKLGIIS